MTPMLARGYGLRIDTKVSLEDKDYQNRQKKN